MKNIIEISDLFKSYKEVRALKDINLSVRKGEMLGLIGPDGAGKSTLYKILSTLLKPDKGFAHICGLDTVRDYRKLRTIIGYMPEKFSLYQDLSVMENLNFFASLFGVKVKDNFDLIAPIFHQLKRFPDRKAGELSGGMKQKLALSCALIHRPEILLLDEPTTGVDAVSRNEFWEMLATLREKGITILVSTSYMDEATRCDRIAMINKGEILNVNTPENLINGIDEKIYNAVGPDMFKLLMELREMPCIEYCYTFGATLHLVVSESFNIDETLKQLSHKGLNDIKIYPAKPDIEDLFIKITRDDQ